MAPMVIPPLRLGAAPAQGSVPFDADESGSYSDEEFAEESDGGNPSPDSAATGRVHGEGASRSHQDGPTRGRQHPNFPVRPGSPQPMMQSPIPSPGRGRGRGAGAAAALDYRGAAEEDDEDDATAYIVAGGRQPGNGRASPSIGYGGAPRRVGGSAPELRPHSMQDEELSEASVSDRRQEMHPDEMQHAQMMAEAAHAYPSYSWRETLSRFPSLLRLYPLAASSEAALEAPDSEHNAGRDGSSGVAMGPVNQLEGNEEYLNSHPSAASSARPPASQPAAVPVTKSPKLQSPRQPHHSVAPHQQQTSPAISSASKAVSSTPRQSAQVTRPVPLTMLEPNSLPTTTEWQGAHPSSVRSSGVPSVPNTPPCTAYVANGAPPVQTMSLATPRSAPPRGAWARPRGISGPTNEMFHDDLAAAWAEVEDARREVERRERELELREASLLRAEARNAASARQLSELRRRLEDYSEELEEGVVSLTAQQQAAREERREASELQARARRLYAAAAAQRDDRKRSWERWSHLGATGPI